jgi:hypothetical protein
VETRSEKSAEVVVAANKGRRAEREGASDALSMRTVLHQMPAMAGRVESGQGEALSQTASDETGLLRREPEGAGRGLLAQVLARGNMQLAWKRVKANKGASCADDSLLRPAGSATSLMTSTSRTARCGPACRVVWQRDGQQCWPPLCRLRRDRFQEEMSLPGYERGAHG